MKVILHGDEHAAGLQFYKAPKSWIDALEHCHNQDSSLAEIHNQTVQASVNSSLLNKDSMLNGMWIGLERSIFGRNSTWKWISGTPVGNHCPWNKSYPVDALNHHCGKIIWVAELGQFKWLDACCHEELPFICQSNQIYSVIHFLFWMKGLAERFSPRFFFLYLRSSHIKTVWRSGDYERFHHPFTVSLNPGVLGDCYLLLFFCTCFPFKVFIMYTAYINFIIVTGWNVPTTFWNCQFCRSHFLRHYELKVLFVRNVDIWVSLFEELGMRLQTSTFLRLTPLKMS